MTITSLTSGTRTSIVGDFAFQNDLITVANTGSYPITVEVAAIDGSSAVGTTQLGPGQTRGYRMNVATRIYATANGGNSSVRVTTLNVPDRFTRSGFNPAKLTRLWRALAQTLHSGGVDILLIGDSITRGLGLGDPDGASMGAVLRKRLQTAWNPDNTPGGAGFVPAKWTWSSGAGTVANPSHPSTRTSTAYDDRLMSGAGNYIFRLNAGGGGSVAFANITNVTDIVAVHQTNSGSGVTAGWAITGTASSSGTVASQGTLTYGVHTLAGTGLSAAGTYTWTLSPPGSGDVRGSGIIRFNGDYSKGVRVQNLGCSGILLYDPNNNLGYYRADDPTGVGSNTAAFFQANLDNFSSTAPSDSTSGGAKRAGLVIMRLGTNDRSTYITDSGSLASGYTTYLTYLRLVVARILARTSVPCVLLALPTAPGSSAEELYRNSIVEAARVVEAENEHVAIIEEDTVFGRVARGSLPTGFDYGDELHWSVKGHGFTGEFIADALIEGRRWARDNNLMF